VSILRVFPGSNDKESKLKSLIQYVVGDAEKKQWKSVSYDNNSNMVKGYGIPEVASLDEMFSAFILPHIAYGYPGTRRCYHCLLDFNGLLCVNDAGVISWEINKFFLPYSVQFIQGVHVTKSGGRMLWPHTHVLINTITLFGPNAGKKFRLEKPVLYLYKLHMNNVLRKYGLPIIPIYEKGV